MIYRIFCKKVNKYVTVAFDNVNITTLNDNNKIFKPGLLCNCSETGPYNLCFDCTALTELNKDK